MGKLTGQVALVTGAGRGIGAAIARKLAAEGASILLNDLDPEPTEAAVAAITAAGGRAVAFPGDAAAAEFGERAIAAMVDTLGGVDIIVNNAGYIWNSAIQNMTDEQWYAMIDVHATAPFRILRAATGYIRQAVREETAAGRPKHRKVVNISSISGLYGAATQFAYAAGKSAMIGMTRTLAKEWGRYRVNVNAVAFGYIETRLTQTLQDRPATISVHGRDLKVGLDAATTATMESLIPLGRRGTPEEAAGAVYLLCTPESDYISGQILVCGGGLLL